MAYLEDGSRWNAVRQKVIQPCADLQKLGGRSVLYDLGCCDRDKCLPVRRWNGSAIRHFLTIISHLLEPEHTLESTLDESTYFCA
jgi:hypothetical protein